MDTPYNRESLYNGHCAYIQLHNNNKLSSVKDTSILMTLMLVPYNNRKPGCVLILIQFQKCLLISVYVLNVDYHR